MTARTNKTFSSPNPIGGRLHVAAFVIACVGATAMLGLSAFARPSAPDKSDKVDFTRDIQPLLKAHCFQCHAGSQNQGGLRLDSRESILKGGASGAVLTPGGGGTSLLVARLAGQDGKPPKPRMPLGFAPLTDRQISLIQAWIDQGANWPQGTAAKHWAYAKPVRAKIPTVKNAAWVRNTIDSFILTRLEREGLKPSPEADKTTLIRRVTLDLTGLPPTPGEVDAFLADHSPTAYEKVVDRLLASPHYGERMALPWLDAARYADSNGFQQDGDTFQYVWRDWVVRAMNANMPFDQFTIQQLAGDLLPSATLDQKIATGFNRCHLLNGEGGAIPEEQRNVILFDRVDVTATTWLGATMACAQCHNHKYDPYTQRDYYQFMAFFNNVPETGTPPGGGQYRIADPWVSAPSETETAKQKDYESRIAKAKMEAEGYANGSEIKAAQFAWEASALQSTGEPLRLENWSAVGPFPAASFDTAFDTAFAPEKEVDLSKVYAEGKLKWAPHSEWADGAVHELAGENAAVYLYRIIRSKRSQKTTLSFGSDDGIKAWLNGKQILANKITRAALPDQDKATVDLQPGENRLLVKIVNGGGIGGFYFKASESGLPSNISVLLKKPAANRTESESRQVHDYFLANQPPAKLKDVRDRAAALQKEFDAFRGTVPRVMVMSDARPRKTHLLQRGNYETPGEEVQSDTPACFAPIPTGAPKNRLGLAEWLVGPDNPLTARVQVNRYWQLFFGTGLVKTSENFGTQCEPPTHSELLDWLAVEFMKPTQRPGVPATATGPKERDDPTTQRPVPWDVKRMHKLMVTSATYRQSSKVTPLLRQRDPENKLLARGTRFRMPSLLLRDVALASGGLLNQAIGGKPVYPYQPKGIWDGLAITNERDFTYPQSKGADLFRRSLYTFWRRTAGPADLFDASTRTTCRVRLTVTSTPLHALTTLNDVVWVEAGRNLAEHVIKEAGPSSDARLTDAFRRVCARRPTPDELRILRHSLDRALADFRSHRKSAEEYLKMGESPRDTTLDPAEHAAYAAVCLAIYNLDEALTRE